MTKYTWGMANIDDLHIFYAWSSSPMEKQSGEVTFESKVNYIQLNSRHRAVADIASEFWLRFKIKHWDRYTQYNLLLEIGT